MRVKISVDYALTNRQRGCISTDYTPHSILWKALRKIPIPVQEGSGAGASGSALKSEVSGTEVQKLS